MIAFGLLFPCPIPARLFPLGEAFRNSIWHGLETNWIRFWTKSGAESVPKVGQNQSPIFGTLSVPRMGNGFCPTFGTDSEPLLIQKLIQFGSKIQPSLNTIPVPILGAPLASGSHVDLVLNVFRPSLWALEPCPDLTDRDLSSNPQ